MLLHFKLLFKFIYRIFTFPSLGLRLFNLLKFRLIDTAYLYHYLFTLCSLINSLLHFRSTGSYIESAAGWATKVHTVRGKGAVLRPSLEDTVTPEYVKNVWSSVTDMSKAKHLNAIGEASGYLLEVLEKMKEGEAIEDYFEFDNKELILYALGIGASVKNTEDMRFLYENDSNFAPIPSFFVLPGLLLQMSSDKLISKALPGKQVDFSNILHGEQYLEIVDDLPTSGTLLTTGKVFDVMDKGTGAVVVTNTETFDESGRLLVRNQSSTFVVGAGQFGGKKDPIAGVFPLQPNPKGEPDAFVQYVTNYDQAVLYRLSGDRNPLHIDPQMALLAGFKTPILHGLCTLGYSVRAVLSQYAENNPALFKAVKVRFSGPVLPGQTLRVDMWLRGERVHFRTVVVETGKEVISGAYLDLKSTKAKL